MSNILVSGGRKVTAFSVHGLSCAVMLFAGLLLIDAILATTIRKAEMMSIGGVSTKSRAKLRK
jgi:hypothetical protein